MSAPGPIAYVIAYDEHGTPVPRGRDIRRRGRVIDVRDIIDNADVRKLAGGVTRKTLIAWRAKDFPAPIRTTGGNVELWDRREVRDWLRARAG